MIMTSLLIYLHLAASHAATTYGFGEYMCGNIGRAKKCQNGAVTATGDTFHTDKLTAAIPIPLKMRLKAFYVWVRGESGRCVRIRVNDKKSPRFIGRSGLDLSPAAQEAVSGKRAKKSWSGKIEICHIENLAQAF